MLPQEHVLFRLNNQLCDFSSNGKYLAVAFQSNLLIKDSKNFKTVQTFVFADIIEYFEWSKNSEYVLCSNLKKQIVQVYSIHQPQWKYKISEGSAGLCSVTWAPDSKHILTLSDFNIQITVWCLESLQVFHIQKLKASAINRFSFSPDGHNLAVVVTDDGEETVEIYKTNNWKLSRKLICERLNSIDGISWSPNGELLAIWSSISNEPKLIVYSSLLNKNIAVYSPKKHVIESEAECDYEKELRGIDSVIWSPTGQLLGIIGFNEMVVFLNHVTWRPLLQLYLDPIIRDNNYLNKVYKERISEVKASYKYSSSCKTHSLEEEHERPINIRIAKKDEVDRLLIAKIEIFEFSTCGQYIAVKHQLYPTTLWIWNITSDFLDYLILENSIVAVKWNPNRPHLFIFCETAHMFEWSPQSAKCSPTPRNITVLDCRWNPNGKSLVLCGYNKAVILYIENNQQ